jgi:hypothetical protein
VNQQVRRHWVVISRGFQGALLALGGVGVVPAAFSDARDKCAAKIIDKFAILYFQLIDYEN